MINRFFLQHTLPGGLMLLVLLLTGLAPAGAEGELILDLTLQNSLLRTRGIDWGADGLSSGVPAGASGSYFAWGSSGSAGFSYESRGNRNVRAELAFSFLYPEQDLSALSGGAPGAAGTSEMPLLALDRAYVKARFPLFRLVTGKTRLSWGDGFVFNAGDVIFGSTSTAVDLTAEEVRTETDWLVSANLPLGRFSFLEALVMPPAEDAAEGRILGRLQDTSAGARFYTKAGSLKVEGGYFYRGEENLHRPYLALQGNLGADWYLSTSADLSGDAGFSEALLDSLRDSWRISGGLFHLQQLNRIQSLSLRLEALVRPWREWGRQEPVIASPLAENGAAQVDYPEYGLLLYPEVTYSPQEAVSLSLRSLVSPLDLSAQITLGGSWNILQGYTLSAYAVAQAGEGDDLFAWQRYSSLWRPGQDMVDGLALIFGVNYIY